jgi:hypothetical protein
LKLVDRSTKNLIETFIKCPQKLDKSIWLESNSLTDFAININIPINYKVFKSALERGSNIDVTRFVISPKSLYYFIKHQRVEEVKIILNKWHWSYEKVYQQVIFLTFYVCFECPSDDIFTIWIDFLSTYHVSDEAYNLSEKINFILHKNEYCDLLRPKFYPKLVRRFIDRFPSVRYVRSMMFKMTDDFCYNEMIVHKIPHCFYQNLFSKNITFHREPVISEIVFSRSCVKLETYLRSLCCNMSPQYFDSFFPLFSTSVFHLCYDADWFDPIIYNLILFEKFSHINLPIEKSNFFKWVNFCTQYNVDPWKLFNESIFAQKDLCFFEELKKETRFTHTLLYSVTSINRFHSSVFWYLNKDRLDVDFNIDMGFILTEPHKERKLQICFHLERLCGSKSIHQLWNMFATELINGRLYKDSEEDDDKVIDEFCEHYQTLEMNKNLARVHPNFIAIKKYPILLRWVHLFVVIDDYSLFLSNIHKFDGHVIDFIILKKIVISGDHLMRMEKFSLFRRLFKENLIYFDKDSIEQFCLKFDRMDFYQKHFQR